MHLVIPNTSPVVLIEGAHRREQLLPFAPLCRSGVLAALVVWS